jgi:AAA domain/Domain of unknown function (DUF3854)
MTLSPAHLTQLVNGSGIDAALVHRLGCWTATTPSELAALTFKDYQRRVPALVLPVHDVHGNVALSTIRPDHPRKSKKGKPIKYETPAGAHLALAVDPAHRPLLLQAAVPLLVVEGLKKKWSIDSRIQPDQPLCTLGVIGTNGWMRDGHPLPDWQAVQLQGRDVVIVYDSDATSTPEVRKARQALAQFLQQAGAHVQHIDFPALPGGKCGADDYLVSGHDLQDLLALATTTFPQPEPLITTLADYEEQETTWLWWPYLPRGAFVLLDGDPGVGKSLLTIQLAACLSRGWNLPDQQGKPTLPIGPPQRTLLITAEDSISRTIKKRCRQAGGDDTWIDLFTEWKDSDGAICPFTLQSVTMLERALSRQTYALVVIDPIQAFLGAIDMHRSNETRPVLQALTKVLERHEVAALCVRHPAKPGQGGGKAMHRGLGSIDFMAAARTALFVEEHPTDDTKALICQTKTNLERKGRTLVFSKAEGAFEWKGVSRLPAEVIAGDRRGPDPRAFLEAFCWLEEHLADGTQRPSAALEEQAKDDGVKRDTLHRVKKALNVRSIKGSDDDGTDHWSWQLPPLPVLHPPSPTPVSSVTTVTSVSSVTSDSLRESRAYVISRQDEGETEDREETGDTEETVVVPGGGGVNGAAPPCVHCQGTVFWTNTGGQPICTRCHPHAKGA